MIGSSREFLDTVAGYSNASNSGPKSSLERPIRIGTIDPYYTSGQARILFDGETVISDRGYSWVSTYSPVGGDRVYLVPVGQTYLIGGSFSSSIPYSKYYDIPLASDWSVYSSAFHNPSFTKTPTGLVKLTGLALYSTTTQLADGILIGTLPDGFRPIRDMSFICMTGSNLMGVVEVLTNGQIKTKNDVWGSWVSLANIAFQTEDIAWTQLAYLNGWGAGSVNPERNLIYGKDSIGRTFVNGSFGKTPAPTVDTVAFNLPAGYRPDQGIYTVGGAVVGSSGGFANLFMNSGTGDFSWRVGTVDSNEVSVDGVIIPPAGKSWSTPTMTGTWVSYGSSNNPEYYKDSEGVVHMRGLIKSGTINSSCFTLPTGYKPTKNIVRATVSNGQAARLDIRSDGLVMPVTGNNAWFSLDCSFTAEA